MSKSHYLIGGAAGSEAVELDECSDTSAVARRLSLSFAIVELTAASAAADRYGKHNGVALREVEVRPSGMRPNRMDLQTYERTNSEAIDCFSPMGIITRSAGTSGQMNATVSTSRKLNARSQNFTACAPEQFWKPWRDRKLDRRGRVYLSRWKR